MNLDELQRLAELASLMPWEKSAADIPYAHKSQFLNAITPEAVLKLLKVARAAQASVRAWDVLQKRPIGRFTGEEVPACEVADEALRTALEELK